VHTHEGMHSIGRCVKAEGAGAKGTAVLLYFCSVALGSSSCAKKGDGFACTAPMRCRVKERFVRSTCYSALSVVHLVLIAFLGPGLSLGWYVVF
jgi:hypothetical protein